MIDRKKIIENIVSNETERKSKQLGVNTSIHNTAYLGQKTVESQIYQ